MVKLNESKQKLDTVRLHLRLTKIKCDMPRSDRWNTKQRESAWVLPVEMVCRDSLAWKSRATVSRNG